jgi:Low affinity iron permease
LFPQRCHVEPSGADGDGYGARVASRANGYVRSRMSEPPVEMPSEVSDDVGVFDRFATAASNVSSRAVFFASCVALVLLWAPSILVLSDIDTWQLIINTATTIVTFLMVALLQNSQTRSDNALQHKLNAVADGLADLMEHLADRGDDQNLQADLEELRAAVGLEQRESTTHNRAPKRSNAA